jgi:hypothetical protein
VEAAYAAEALKEKTAKLLTGMGFSEILTNSITNSKYASEERLQHTVRLLNNLSTELDLNAAKHAVHRPGSAAVQQQPQRQRTSGFLNGAKRIALPAPGSTASRRTCACM